MTCREVKGLLPAYVDARLASDDLAIVRAHLDGCDACARERSALERTDGLLSAALSDHPWDDAGVESLVVGLRARARAQVLERPAQPVVSARGASGASGVWVAAAAVLLAAGAFALRAPEPAKPT